ncbi:M15 family metallopeptidase, partial [Cellulomonas algicola]|uniref:M15 family metallopeptidase n=2 Tax=Cellulomonas TaxID=1707 RepID=UPI00190F9247
PHATEPGATAAHPRPAPAPAWSALASTASSAPAARSAVETTVMAPLPLDDEPEPAAPWASARAAAVATETEADVERPIRSRTATVRPTDRHPARMPRLAVRLGVLGALAGVTVVIPTVSQGALEGVGVPGSDSRAAEESLPDTVSALTASSLSILPPSSLVSADGALAAREAAGTSRTEIRSALPGCDGTDRPAGENGLLRTADLCTLWDGHTQLRADAAVSLAEFNQAFVARFGGDLCLSSGYRSLAQQRVVKAQKGGLAAAPGKSNHGWGLAVDLCQTQTSGAKWAWILDNGPAFGWENPAWAKRGGSGPFEPWHWEYAKGVQEDGEYYGR